jgi:hypothetical protein
MLATSRASECFYKRRFICVSSLLAGVQEMEVESLETCGVRSRPSAASREPTAVATKQRSTSVLDWNQSRQIAKSLGFKRRQCIVEACWDSWHRSVLVGGESMPPTPVVMDEAHGIQILDSLGFTCYLSIVDACWQSWRRSQRSCCKQRGSLLSKASVGKVRDRVLYIISLVLLLHVVFHLPNYKNNYTQLM